MAAHPVTPGPRPPAEHTVAPGPATAAVVERMARLVALVDDAGREDLAARLRVVRARLSSETVPVAVLGEFKQGKSSLVNALVRTDVCPVDPDVGTSVPTLVRYGRPSRALAHERGQAGTVTVDVPLEQLEQVVTERGRSRNPPLESVEVLLDRTLLRTGLEIVDTPGLGGLESADGVAALAVLPQARAVLFATAAAQELTAAEVGYLREVVRRCPTAIVVVTMTDLHEHWRETVERDRAHLAALGLDLPVLGVSSFLRMRAAATGDDALHERSGFPGLLRALGAGVLRVADQERAQAVAAELRFVEGQLRGPAEAEREVLRDPGAAAAVVRRLETGATRTGQLASPSASWQVTLLDRSHDLARDVAYDLEKRLTALTRLGEARIDESDPRETWDDVAAWVRIEAVRAAVANLHLLVDRADRLLREVAEHFDGDVEDLGVDLPVPASTVRAVPDVAVRFAPTSSRQVLGLLTAARVAYGGAFVGGIGGAVLLTASATVLAPVGALVGVALARRIIREDRQRELQMHRETAKRELHRFVHEVWRSLDKDCDDAVRRTQRRVRDELTTRAELVHRSAAEALEAARRAAALDPADRARRSRELERSWRELGAASVDEPPPARATGRG